MDDRNTRMPRVRRWRGVLVAGACLAGAPALAQSGGFGGSFDSMEQPPATQESPATQPGGAGGGTDGFGGGQGDAAATGAPGTAGGASVGGASAGGADGFGGGSFADGGAGDSGTGAGTQPGGGSGGSGGSTAGAGADGFGGGSFATGGGSATPPVSGGGQAGGASPGGSGDGFGGGSVAGQGGTPPDTGGNGWGGGGGSTGGGVAGGGGASGGTGSGGMGAGGAGAGGTGAMSQLTAFELQDFGVPATQGLYAGPPHGPTPTSIPGGRVVTTEQLVALKKQQVVLIDVLGGQMTVPGALPAAGLGAPGSFDDQVQVVMVQGLQQVVGGNRAAPIVFFCQGPQCWLSYNAALRAIAAGYTNVFWYRGGIEAWGMAGLQLAQAY